jgi:hypothetical protein
MAGRRFGTLAAWPRIGTLCVTTGILPAKAGVNAATLYVIVTEGVKQAIESLRPTNIMFKPI